MPILWKVLLYVLGMYWYVLVCTSKCFGVLDHELIADISMLGHTALQSTCKATFTIDTPVMSLNWIFSPQDGQRERPSPKHWRKTFQLCFQSQAYQRLVLPSWVVLTQYGWIFSGKTSPKVALMKQSPSTKWRSKNYPSLCNTSQQTSVSLMTASRWATALHQQTLEESRFLRSLMVKNWLKNYQ